MRYEHPPHKGCNRVTFKGKIASESLKLSMIYYDMKILLGTGLPKTGGKGITWPVEGLSCRPPEDVPTGLGNGVMKQLLAEFVNVNFNLNVKKMK